MPAKDPWDREKVISILEPFFRIGYSVTKACKAAGIPQPTVATWILQNKELRLKIEAWQSSVDTQARKVWADKVYDGDYQASRDWAELISGEAVRNQKITQTSELTVTHVMKREEIEKMSKDEIIQRLAERQGGRPIRLIAASGE